MSKVYGLIFTNSDPRNAPAISLAPTLVTFFQIGGSTLAAPGITKPIPTVGLYTFTYDPGLTLPVYFLADGGAAITDNTQRYLSGMLDPIQQVDQQAMTLTAIGSTNIALGNTNIALNSSQIAQGNTLLIGQTLIFNQGASIYTLEQTINSQATSLTANGVSVYAAALTLLAQTQTLAVNISLNVAAIDEINLKIGSTLSSFGSTSVDPGDLFGYMKRMQEFNEGNQTFDKTTGIWDISTRGNTLIAQKTLTNTSSDVTKL